MTDDPRERMYLEAKEKYGIAFDKDGVVFDRHEARPATKAEIEMYGVVLDGKLAGETKICGTLDADVIERNLRWIKRVYAGIGVWVPTENVAIEVDKESKAIRITT